MKKIILTVVTVLAFGFANAQDVKFGVKGGLNFTNVTGGQFSGTSKVGFHVGGLAEIKFTDKLAIQPELLFSTKGANYNLMGSTSTVNLSYIDIPVMVKYFVIDKLSIEVGPQISLLTSAKRKDPSETVDIKEFTNKTDFGLNIGAGYELKGGILLQARYYLGLSDLSKAEPDGEVSYKDKNSGLFLSVGYKF